MVDRRFVFFINPPNSNDVCADSSLKSVSKGVQHTDWANFPHLGILSLASFVDGKGGITSLYMDGVIHGFDRIVDEIKFRCNEVLAVCLSVITANYEAGLMIAKEVKRLDRSVIVILGNDHFTALSSQIMSYRHDVIDCGFIGNEVHKSLSSYLVDVKRGGNGALIDNVYPGMIRRNGREIVSDPQVSEGINNVVDYGLIDRCVNHSDIYTKNFQSRLSDRIEEVTRVRVKRGVPVEIARGCIKFSGNDACSFCSIQYGGMWRNYLPHVDAWQAIHNAWKAGYDYIYVTADELPLTFARLMIDMASDTPKWWSALDKNERPVLVGYARADGMEKEVVLRAMSKIGFRILFVGVDAGVPLSLRALNKPLRSKSPDESSRRMHESNIRAIDNAKKIWSSYQGWFCTWSCWYDQASS